MVEVEVLYGNRGTPPLQAGQLLGPSRSILRPQESDMLRDTAYAALQAAEIVEHGAVVFDGHTNRLATSDDTGIGVVRTTSGGQVLDGAGCLPLGWFVDVWLVQLPWGDGTYTVIVERVRAGYYRVWDQVRWQLELLGPNELGRRVLENQNRRRSA